MRLLLVYSNKSRRGKNDWNWAEIIPDKRTKVGYNVIYGAHGYNHSRAARAAARRHNKKLIAPLYIHTLKHGEKYPKGK